MSTPEFGSNGLTVVSLFAGCGGSSLGYRMAGYRELLAVEWDAKACASFRSNFPDVPLYEGDICGLDGTEALRLADVRAGELDLLDGSPPCQGFSTAGKRRFADGRNRLFEEFTKLLMAFRPRAFVMENVSGLRKGKMRLVFAEMTLALKAAGYLVSCRELNAWWYGVPQDRRRLIWVGTRADLGVAPSHPQPMRKKPVTVAEALGVAFWEKSHGWFPGGVRCNAPAQTVRSKLPVVLAERESLLVMMEKQAGWGVRRLANTPSFTLRSASPPKLGGRYGELWGGIPWGGDASDVVGKGFNNCVKPHPDRPSPTLPKTQSGRGYATVVHPLECRALTIEEGKKLQGFPEWFDLTPVAGYSRQWALIGDSVPPPMAEAVGRHVAALLKGAGGG